MLWEEIQESFLESVVAEMGLHRGIDQGDCQGERHLREQEQSAQGQGAGQPRAYWRNVYFMSA